MDTKRGKWAGGQGVGGGGAVVGLKKKKKKNGSTWSFYFCTLF